MGEKGFCWECRDKITEIMKKQTGVQFFEVSIALGEIAEFSHCHHEPKEKGDKCVLIMDHVDVGRVETSGEKSTYLSKFNLSDGRIIYSYATIGPDVKDGCQLREKIDRARLIDAGFTEADVKKSICDIMNRRSKPKCWCEMGKIDRVQVTIWIKDNDLPTTITDKPSNCPKCGRVLYDPTSTKYSGIRSY